MVYISLNQVILSIVNQLIFFFVKLVFFVQLKTYWEKKRNLHYKGPSPFYNFEF